MPDRIPVDEAFYLSEPTGKDARAFVQWLDDRQIHDRTLEIPFPYTREDADKFLQDSQERRRRAGRPMEFAIRTTDGALIGMIGFRGKYPDDLARDEISFWLARPYWTQGIMTKVLDRFTRFAFEERGMKRLEMSVFDFNVASRRVAEKCGYRLERTLPKAHRKNGAEIDAKLYVIDRSF